MKKLLYFFIGCVIVGTIVSTAFSLLPVFPTLGKGYLTTVEQKKYDQAYMVMSSEFKKHIDLPHFIMMVQQTPALHEFNEVTWLKTVQDKKAKKGYIVGVITTKKNTKVMIQIDYVQEKGENWQDQGWRIKDLHFEGAEKK